MKIISENYKDQLIAWAKGLGYPDVKDRVVLITRNRVGRELHYVNAQMRDAVDFDDQILGIYTPDRVWHPVPEEVNEYREIRRTFGRSGWTTSELCNLCDFILSKLEALEKKIEEVRR